MKYLKSKILIFLSIISYLITFSSCINKQDETKSTSFEIKNGSYYSTVKLTDKDFAEKTATYTIDKTKWEGDFNAISKIEMDELFIKCITLSKRLFRNPKDLTFLTSYQLSKDDIIWPTCFEKVYENEGQKERNGTELFLIIKGTPKQTFTKDYQIYGDGSTWRVEFYIEGDKISEPHFVEIRDDASA